MKFNKSDLPSFVGVLLGWIIAGYITIKEVASLGEKIFVIIFMFVLGVILFLIQHYNHLSLIEEGAKRK